MIDENYWSLAPFLRKAVSWINAATSAGVQAALQMML